MENSKARKMLKLTDNPEFVELILEDFIKDGIHREVLSNNLDSSAVIDQLKARQTLHDYILAIISAGSDAES